MHNRLPVQCQLLVRCLLHRLPQSMSSARPTPSCAPTLVPKAAQPTEPEATPVTSAIPQSEDAPVPQAFPYITHTVNSDRDDVKVIASTPFASTLV